jgi:hypothetical protein
MSVRRASVLSGYYGYCSQLSLPSTFQLDTDEKLLSLKPHDMEILRGPSLGRSTLVYVSKGIAHAAVGFSAFGAASSDSGQADGWHMDITYGKGNAC